MNCVISVVNPYDLDSLTAICDELGLKVSVEFLASGTATKSTLELLGINSSRRRVVLTLANGEKTAELFKQLKRKLYIGAVGRGMAVAVPIKSIGGGKTVAYLSGEAQNARYTPELNYSYELIVVIANEGRNEMVMDAARAAGARGGTILHGKGTASKEAEKFFKMSIGSEKEVLLIVANTEHKSEIMRSILRDAGPNSEAGAIAFSMPISELAGFGLLEDL